MGIVHSLLRLLEM